MTSASPWLFDTRGALAGKTLTQITAGADHECALDTAGAAYCWGDNTAGELGNGSHATVPQPPWPSTTAVSSPGRP